MPEVGEKFRTKGLREQLSFIKENGNGQVIWWEFIGVESGKRRNYYPEEVYPANKSRPSSRKRARDSFYIEPGRKAQDVTINGDTVSIL